MTTADASPLSRRATDDTGCRPATRASGISRPTTGETRRDRCSSPSTPSRRSRSTRRPCSAATRRSAKAKAARARQPDDRGATATRRRRALGLSVRVCPGHLRIACVHIRLSRGVTNPLAKACGACLPFDEAGSSESLRSQLGDAPQAFASGRDAQHLIALRLQR